MDIYLDKIKKEDMESIYKWFSDSEFLKYYDYYPPVPQSRELVDKTMRNYENENSLIFAVRKLHSIHSIIGIAGFDDIIKENEVATLFIGLGENEERGKGFGMAAMKLLLKTGFNELNLHRIQLNVLSFNERAISLYEKCGFKKEGIFREFALRDGKRHDLYLYGLLRNEWCRSTARGLI